MTNFNRTKPIKHFKCGNVEIALHVENSRERFAWCLEVDGDMGPISTHYSGIYEHKGFHLATAYWDGIFPEFTPFQIVKTKEA